MNKKKIGVLLATIAFSAAPHAAFDLLGVSTYIYGGDTNDFAGDELPLLQFVSLSFEDGSVTSLMSAPTEEVDSELVSLSASAVPVPSAVWFFGSALVALTVIQRRA